MIGQSLNGAWQLRECATEEWLAGAVPGGVHTDLMDAGRIGDPFVCDEELRVQWVAERDWEYRRDFVVESGLAAEERIAIVFDGLDTLAEISLNGEQLGAADNMFRTWRWDVTGRLRPGANELSVVFRSAVRRAAELDAVRHLDSVANQLAGAPYLRKAPCHFGWDWGPKLPNVGFWQGGGLEAWSRGRIVDVHVRQEIQDGTARLTADIRVERPPEGSGAHDSSSDLTATLRVRHPNGHVEDVRTPIPAGSSTAALSIDIADPELWWPNGLGGQPLYRLQVELADDVRVRDARFLQIGIRTLELRREPDEWGESFTFVVNGVPVFAKGSNWIPADSFPARVTPAQLEALLGAAAETNHNMIRVWGGGHYETEAFYDLCDRFGILVWQDLMFACSVYPLTDATFLDNLAAEVREQVQRLRHRACLALWCGNNEMERGWTIWGWTRPQNEDLRAAYLRFFSDTLPSWVAAEDNATPYWPSSPSSGRPLEEPIGGARGDEHEWVVWHGLAPFSGYGHETYRFVSEFGFESLPALATVATFAPDPADWNLGSPMLDHHQRCPDGNARILFYMAQQFRLPGDFPSFVYLSQILHAEAMRVGVEHWRRARARCSGALYWQLNDCWPVSSWASIDYFGRWKALQYATRRFYAPILLSAELESETSAVSVAITNDTPDAWRGEIRWTLERFSGEAVAGGHESVVAAALATTEVCRVDVPAELVDRRSTVLVTELFDAESGRVACSVTTFVPDKQLALVRPAIEWHIEARAEGRGGAVGAGRGGAVGAGRGESIAAGRATIHLRSDSLARWVELSLDGADVVFSDNYFDIPAGRPMEVSFDLPTGWSIDLVRQGLRIRSVVDTYA
jgi:beta-mannosidase